MEKYSYPELAETVFRQTLPNGLTVVVVPRPGFTKKLAYFVTDYGAIHTKFTLNGTACDAPAGVAHFLEHKMFDLPDRDVSAEFAALGAIPNAFTSYDLTAYYFSCSENFPQCLRLLLEFVSTPYFTEESVNKEQGIIGQEIGMNEDSPDTRVFENLMNAMYDVHPIRVPILGDRASIAQITPDVLYACHKAFYRPGNMFLCVIGDVDAEEVKNIALEILPEKDDTIVTRETSWQEEMTCPKTLVEDAMEVAMPMFYLGFKCEPAAIGETSVRQEAVGDLAAEALFGESSALYLRLYEQGLIDSSFGGGFETIDGMAMLCAYGDSLDPQAVRNAILEEAGRICREGIESSAFLRMKRSALGQRIRALDSFDSTAFRLCAYHFNQFDYFRFPAVYQAVELAEVQAFLNHVVTDERCALSVIYPTKEA